MIERNVKKEYSFVTAELKKDGMSRERWKKGYTNVIFGYADETII